jgi:hypothetical protein
MGHERGELDDGWGFKSMDLSDSNISREIQEGPLDLGSLTLDSAAMHTLCLEVFRAHAESSESLSSVRSFQEALNQIMARIECDDFEDTEIDDLWSGSLNFAEFYLLVRELLVSMHRAMSVGIDVEDVLVQEMNKTRI